MKKTTNNQKFYPIYLRNKKLEIDLNNPKFGMFLKKFKFKSYNVNNLNQIWCFLNADNCKLEFPNINLLIELCRRYPDPESNNICSLLIQNENNEYFLKNP
jgi:hypothetical protein